MTITPTLTEPTAGLDTIADYESGVRSYVRSWPTVFDTAHGSWITDTDGHRYLDFFAGAGALNYGHNNSQLQQSLIDYVSHDGVAHSLDMASAAKTRFLETFHERILTPRNLNYRIQFPGPTGTNAVEAALKVARLATGRQTVVYFSNAFHGMSLGSLAVTANPAKRDGAGIPLPHSLPLPYGSAAATTHGSDGLATLRQLLDTPGSGLDTPAAVIVETVQGEGGINVATDSWLRELRQLCTDTGMVLIVDDIQMGCGRTGNFFSFERSGIVPDIVTLSKSISGYGLPMALTLIRPDLDVMAPGQHNGTFRGNNHAFVTATAALETFWGDGDLTAEVDRKAQRLVTELRTELPSATVPEIRGRGLAQGLVFAEPGAAGRVAKALFDNRMLAETCGAQDQVLKLLPPLTVTDAELDHGIATIGSAVAAA